MTPEQELDLRMAEPESGSYIQLRVAYPGSPKTYSYAGVEAAGVWYLTGTEGAEGRTWNGLINWLKEKNADVVSLQAAATWEDLL